ncbi:MAG: peptide chain release factor N(5)-glutamine methyltransferase [Acidimicrobiia bacterium]|nr:MAG: peptide chain release factor N(5)-glutamine methyltransferase [Acidimicrobiia bacterium]
MRSRDLIADRKGIAEHEAIRLVMAATGRSRTDVLMGFDVTDHEVEWFESYVQRRLGHEPLQYIEGTVPFGPVVLYVDARVLIPRPETEYMFERLAALADDPRVIVDLCTGSGNLALALAVTFPKAAVYAVDLSSDATAVARINAERNGLDVTVLTGDLFDPLPSNLMGKVDLLVSNPPYLAEEEVERLPPDVLAEPRMALVAGARGDEILKRIASGAGAWLRPDGMVACEISEFCVERTLGHFAHLDGEVHADLTETDRFVVGHGTVV